MKQARSKVGLVYNSNSNTKLCQCTIALIDYFKEFSIPGAMIVSGYLIDKSICLLHAKSEWARKESFTFKSFIDEKAFQNLLEANLLKLNPISYVKKLKGKKK